MAAKRISGEIYKGAATDSIRLVLALMLGIAATPFAQASSETPTSPLNQPASDPTQRSLQDTAWVLYQVNDTHGNAVAPFADSADGSRAIVPVLFRTDYLEFATACRRWVAPYRQQGGRIVIAQAYVSQDACEGDRALAPLTEHLRGQFVMSFARIAGFDEPVLRLKAASSEEFLLYDNGALRFTSPDDVLPQPQAIYLQIGPDTMGCGYNGPDIPGRAENVCITARPAEQSFDGTWHASSEPFPVMPAIRGFEPPEGIRSIVRILRYKLANPNIHAAGYRDVLDMVIEQDLPENPSGTYHNPPHHWIP